MPSVSKSQQRAAGAALAAKLGKRDVKTLTGASLQMYKSMTIKQLREFAEGSMKGKPEKKRMKDKKKSVNKVKKGK